MRRGHRNERWRGRFGLRRRIFVWFGVSIVMTALIVSALMRLLGREVGFADQTSAIKTFIAGRFVRVWDDASERNELAYAIATELGASVVLTDAHDKRLYAAGPACFRHRFIVPLSRGDKPVGKVTLCFGARHTAGPWILGLAVGVAGLALWAASGVIARRLSRPISDLVRVTQDIGAGKLRSRARLHRHARGEAGALAESIHDMAMRIEKQLRDQRELLAAVSHEVRTPLARLRVLTELAHDGGLSAQLSNEFEREIREIDELVGQLLANAKLEFAELSLKSLDVADTAANALARAGASADCLALVGFAGTIEADPTLIGRALGNLLENARTYGNGVRALRATGRDSTVRFEVEDNGPGFAEDEAARVFEPFYRGDQGRAHHPNSLGLGLALVRRIAEAHRGRAFAENAEGGGARVGIELPRTQHDSIVSRS